MYTFKKKGTLSHSFPSTAREMDWRLWNRGRGPELPDLAARNIPAKWNGTTRVTYHHRLRPGRSHEERRFGQSNDEIAEMGDLERAAKMLQLPENPVDVRKKDAGGGPRRRKRDAFRAGWAESVPKRRI